MPSLSKSPRLRNIFIVVNFIIVLILIILTLRVLNLSQVGSTSKPTGPTSIPYTLDWQNQPGTPFTITNPDTFQFFDIHLVLIDNSSFVQNTNITIYAYGTMSQSLINSSLAYIQIAYDGSIPYPPIQGYAAGPSLSLETITDGHGGIAFGPSVYVAGQPISITWAFAGGPHYPTVTIHYWNGGDIIQEFSSAPITIQSAPTTPPSQSNFILELIVVIWTIGGVILAMLDAIYSKLPTKPLYVPLK